MRKLRIISLLMCIVLLFSFAGCNTGESLAKIKTEDDIIGQDGCFLYTVISADENSNIKNATRETTYVKRQLAEAFDIKVNSNTDKKVKADKDNYEILIGNTNRAESKKALKALKDNRVQNIEDWMIKTIGNKICIVSVSDDNLANAIRYFTENCCTKLSDFSKAADDFEYIYTKKYDVQNGADANIGDVRIGKYTIVTTREKSLLYTLKISEFTKIFEEKYGIKIGQKSDTETEGEYEIVVGNTSREISKTYKPKDDNYVIALEGGKLVVVGGNDIATAYAFQRILDMELSARKAKKAFTIPKGFKEEGEAKTKNEYTLAWADEFNFFNRDIWKTPVGGESSGPSPNGGTTYNRGAKNVTVRNGNLVLQGNRLNETDFDSSSVHSYQGFAYRYGVLEVRMKLAPIPMCTTIWGSRPYFQIKNGKREVLTEIKNRFELDVLENYGQKDWFASNIHHWWSDGSEHSSLDGTKYSEAKKYTYSDPDKFASEFHIFSYEWTPYSYKFAVDGDVYFEYDISTLDNTGYTQTPIDIRLTGGYSNVNYYLQKKYGDDAPKHGEALVDYVRVYQNDKYDNILWLSPKKD